MEGLLKKTTQIQIKLYYDVFRLLCLYLPSKQVLQLRRISKEWKDYVQKFIENEKINLSCCNEIKDVGLQYLKGVHIINLSYCYQITYVGL
jgi:hypothetical protein